MSKKGKLILATALFGASLFGASCGGGGGGGDATASAPPSPPPPPPPPPAPTVEGRVLALLNLGTPSAGTLMPVTICELRSDGKAVCGTDLNPNADVELEYLYEFGNGNVVLKDSDGKIYFFNGSQVIKLDKFRPLGASSSTPETTEPGGITIPNPTDSNTMVYATPNFVILVNNSQMQLVVVTSSGKVIKDSVSPDSFEVIASCELVKKDMSTFKLNPDGSSSTTTIPDEVLASADGKFLVRVGTNNIRLTNSECSASGVEVATINNVRDAQMVKVGNDFYIAVRANRNLSYYKVSGDTPTPLNTRITLASNPSPTKYFYALDGRGRLYAITANNRVSVYNIDGTELGSVSISNVAGLLGLADRALARDNASTPNVHEITITSSGATSRNTGTALSEVVNKCTDDMNTKSVDGAGTNFIRCVHSISSNTSSSNTSLHSLTYDSVSGVYGSASSSMLSGAFGRVLFAPNKVLVKADSTIHLCNTTTTPTPTISCSSTDLPALDPTLLIENGNIKYLKSNGNNVFYATTGGAVKVGDIFGPPTNVPIPATGISGGNASFDLTRFAFRFTPVGAPCATQIVYLSSRTASPKTYTIAQPSNACVARILKVY